MRELLLKSWLQSHYAKATTWKTYLTDAKRIYRLKGDLDELYECGRLNELMKLYRFSDREGKATGLDIPNRHKNRSRRPSSPAAGTPVIEKTFSTEIPFRFLCAQTVGIGTGVGTMSCWIIGW